LQILLQDKYNIFVLTVNIEFMWLGTKRMERLAIVYVLASGLSVVFRYIIPIANVYFISVHFKIASWIL